MVTLWPIPEQARAELESGNHVKLTLDRGSVVVGFEEYVKDSFKLCDWKVDNGWNRE